MSHSVSIAILLNRTCLSDSVSVIVLKAAFEMVRFQLRHGNDLLAVDCLKKCDVCPQSWLLSLC